MSYDSKLAMKLAGASVMQLNYWDHHGVVRPSARTGTGSGSRREYSFQDLVALKVAKKLRDEGISLQKIRRALAYLRKHFPEVESPLAELRFVTNGTTFFVLTEDPSVILDPQGGQFVFSFAVGQLIEELKGELKVLVIPKVERLIVDGRPFSVTLTPDPEGGVNATCAEIPVTAQGETEQEAMDNILDVIERSLEGERARVNG